LIYFASKLVSRCSDNSLKSNQMFLYLLKNNKKMIIPANAKKAEIEAVFKNLQKDKKTLKPQDFIGKFLFKGDSLKFQEDLR
jgi:hypothetical protein